MDILNFGPVIAAVRNDSEFEDAISSSAKIIFDLNPDIITITRKIKKAHEANKKLFVHIDLAAGIGKDESGIKFLKAIGVDGILSTRINIIRFARENGVFCVQRFFAVDSKSIDTTASAIKTAKPDMIEIMPGVLFKVIERLKSVVDTPIIAGGLIDCDAEVFDALKSGATAISSGNKNLWKLNGDNNE